METLAEKLERYIENKNITLAALAKSCRIDRSTMFQYVHGTRPLKNREHLEQIMNRLALTLSEREELAEIFEIEKIGYELFYRRKKLESFIRSLPTLNEKPEEHKWKVQAAPNIQNLDLYNSAMPSSCYISNHLELSQMFFSLLYRSHVQKEDINILMQPKKTSLLDLLIHPSFEHSDIKISHILCLDDFKNDRSGNNIDCYHMLIRYFLLRNRYEPFYFYGNTKERYGTSNPFPYFVCTEHWVLQIAADENTGILHTDSGISKAFQHLFSKISRYCQPLGTAFNGLNRELCWYETYVNPESCQNTIELCTGLCSSQFWDKQLIDTYLNPQLPGADQLKGQLVQYCKSLYESKRTGNIRILLNPSYVLDFIKTGIFKEYPKIFFAKPLEKKDRKLILERVLKACKDGWYQICFLDETLFPLQYRWELCVDSDTVTIQYFHLEMFRTLFINEPGLVEDMYGYLESLWTGQGTVSGENAVKLLKTWMEQYLK